MHAAANSSRQPPSRARQQAGRARGPGAHRRDAAEEVRPRAAAERPLQALDLDERLVSVGVRALAADDVGRVAGGAGAGAGALDYLQRSVRCAACREAAGRAEAALFG